MILVGWASQYSSPNHRHWVRPAHQDPARIPGHFTNVFTLEDRSPQCLCCIETGLLGETVEIKTCGFPTTWRSVPRGGRRRGEEERSFHFSLSKASSTLFRLLSQWDSLLYLSSRELVSASCNHTRPVKHCSTPDPQRVKLLHSLCSDTLSGHLDSHQWISNHVRDTACRSQFQHHLAKKPHPTPPGPGLERELSC